MRVLILSNKDDIIDMLQISLKKHKIEDVEIVRCLECFNKKLANSEISIENYDLMLLDQNLSQNDGVGCASKNNGEQIAMEMMQSDIEVKICLIGEDTGGYWDDNICYQIDTLRDDITEKLDKILDETILAEVNEKSSENNESNAYNPMEKTQ